MFLIIHFAKIAHWQTVHLKQDTRALDQKYLKTISAEQPVQIQNKLIKIFFLMPSANIDPNSSAPLNKMAPRALDKKYPKATSP